MFPLNASGCLLAIALLAFAIGRPADALSVRKLTAADIKFSFANFVRGPTPASTYLDGIFGNYDTATAQLCPNFTKSSNTAVVYMCYERDDVIRKTLAALLASEGISQYDLIISQDGGSGYILDVPESAGTVYIRHPVNLCTGLHHYFVKHFTFDIMGYENLVVVEEDNILHPQALQMLSRTLALSVADPTIGLVSITDMDNTLLVDTARYNAAVLPTEVAQGHLWVYAVHASRYQAVRDHLADYYEIIKTHDYRMKDQPPLSDAIVALRSAKGMATDQPLSQDAFFVSALRREGYRRRFTTMVRLFEPVGWQGLHFREDPSTFYGVYGKGMYAGRIDGEPFDVSVREEDRLRLVTDCRARLDDLYQQILGRPADERAAAAAASRLLTGKLNAVELVRNLKLAADRRKHLAARQVAAARA